MQPEPAAGHIGEDASISAEQQQPTRSYKFVEDARIRDEPQAYALR
jgi:hypothetical protein